MRDTKSAHSQLLLRTCSSTRMFIPKQFSDHGLAGKWSKKRSTRNKIYRHSCLTRNGDNKKKQPHQSHQLVGWQETADALCRKISLHLILLQTRRDSGAWARRNIQTHEVIWKGRRTTRTNSRRQAKMNYKGGWSLF